MVLLLTLLAAQAVDPRALQLQPHVDRAWGFRILRPAPWKVHRAEDVGLVVFYRSGPFRPPRFVVLPQLLAQGRLPPHQAARTVLQDLMGLDRHPGLRWGLVRATASQAEGQARWRDRSSTVRMVFWLRVHPGGHATQVTFLAGEATDQEFPGLWPLFRRMQLSYAPER